MCETRKDEGCGDVSRLRVVDTEALGNPPKCRSAGLFQLLFASPRERLAGLCAAAWWMLIGLVAACC